MVLFDLHTIGIHPGSSTSLDAGVHHHHDAHHLVGATKTSFCNSSSGNGDGGSGSYAMSEPDDRLAVVPDTVQVAEDSGISTTAKAEPNDGLVKDPNTNQTDEVTGVSED